tara:strand:+ start:7768 stop:8487 length:720 start_codon:yes stop_codon:yes gene_type:complete
MIQAITETNLTTYLQTEDNRINTSIARANIKHLCKFTNDMDGSVDYAYAHNETIYDRYTKFTFNYNAVSDRYLGRINFLPSGYWKYEIYEVTWTTPPVEFALTNENAPATEEFVFEPAAAGLGVVQGLVTKGKMYVDEAAGTEEVQYTQNGKQVQTITIVDGGTGYTGVPTLTISGGGNPITTATATCTVVGGKVRTVTITNAGNGYTENPVVTVGLAGASATAQLIANINETNYIYTG